MTDANQEHEWIRRPAIPWLHCKKCGVVKRADGGNGACRGHVRVTVRNTSDQPEGGRP